MAISNFELTPEVRAANLEKMKATRARQLRVRYGEMFQRYREGNMFLLNTREAGERLGVAGSTVCRMLKWAKENLY